MYPFYAAGDGISTLQVVTKGTKMMKKMVAVLGMAAFCCMSAASTSYAGDNGNGTVTVNGLVWLKDAGCLGKGSYSAGKGAVAGLSSGQCGLTDGSTSGQWRLPSPDEMRMLSSNLGLFNNVATGYYWTSEVKPSSFNGKLYVTLYDPQRVVTTPAIETTTRPLPVWPVKR